MIRMPGTKWYHKSIANGADNAYGYFDFPWTFVFLLKHNAIDTHNFLLAGFGAAIFSPFWLAFEQFWHWLENEVSIFSNSFSSWLEFGCDSILCCIYDRYIDIVNNRPKPILISAILGHGRDIAIIAIWQTGWYDKIARLTNEMCYIKLITFFEICRSSNRVRLG